MNVAQLRKLLANLPDDMDVRMYASEADELHVRAAETYPANPHSAYDKRATLMLSDKLEGGGGAGSTIIFDETDGE